MGTNHDEKTKDNRITEEAFLQCVAGAVNETRGVYSLGERMGDSLYQGFTGRRSLRKGIKVARGGKGIIIDIFVVVEYGVHIPDVAFNIQTNVKHALKEEFDLKIEAINIQIQGVHTTRIKR
ncbi:MAG: Asp23/Gls24 family envelope stress response protein [Firmicutes bacterium]|nr:Asp23/Gls24 family envelope stress response protein [Bacillota bacterium]MBR7149284.1 Asp23/Gls24 family envelope stress response protein [Bacillota bacterium]